MKTTFFKRAGKNFLKLLEVVFIDTLIHLIEIFVAIREYGWKHSNWDKHIYVGAAAGFFGYMACRSIFAPLHWFVEIFLFTFGGMVIIRFAEGLQSMISGKIEAKRDSDDRTKDVLVTTIALSIAMVICKFLYLLA